MKEERTKKIAFLCALMMLFTIAIPGNDSEVVEAATKTKLTETKISTQVESPSSVFYVGIDNPATAKTYTATVSDSKIAALCGYIRDKNLTSATFEFWAKKTGKVNVTVKEKNGSKYKKIGTAKVTIKKSKYYSSSDSGVKKAVKYLKKDITYIPGFGVSLEVVKLNSIKKIGKKTKLTFTLSHAVTNDEYNLTGGTYRIDVFKKNKNWDYTSVYCTIKKGSKTMTATTAEAFTKGKIYYSYGFSRAKNAGYTLKAKCQ